MTAYCTLDCSTDICERERDPLNGPLSRTTRVSRYQKGKTNLDFTEAIDSDWQWHQLGHMQVCTSLQTDNHASTPPLSFLQARCPSCCQTNSIKALKAIDIYEICKYIYMIVPECTSSHFLSTHNTASYQHYY